MALREMGVALVVEGLAAYQRDMGKVDSATDKASDELKRFEKAQDGAAERSAKFAKQLTVLSASATALAVAGFGAAIKLGADFEHQMSAVGAISGATAHEMTLLAAEAKKIGIDTKFSATEAGKAMELLAQNGVKVTDVLEGGARAATDLAAAGGVDLVIAADAASTAMAVWNLKGAEMTDVVNRLGGAANVSRFGVEDMSSAIAMGAGAAKFAGLSFGDFTTTIAAIAPYFNSGSDAGTSFKTFITRLVPASKEAEKAMAALGLITADGANAFFDSAGKMKSMTEVAGILNGAIGSLTEQQKLEALQTIFGNDAMRAAGAISEITADQFAALDATMKNTDASAVAAQRMDNLSGDVEQLRGSLETTAISIGQRAMPAIRGLAQSATEALNAFSALPASTQSILLLGTALAAATPAAISLGKTIAGMIATMRETGIPTGAKFAGAIGGLTLAFVAADIAVSQLTGHSLTDWLTGAAQKADRAAAAIANVNAVLLAAGANADKIAILTAELLRQAAGFDAASTAASEHKGNLLENFGAMGKSEASSRALGEALIANGATLADLALIYHKLSPRQQDVFDKTTNVRAAMAALTGGAELTAVALGGAALAAELLPPQLDAIETAIAQAEPEWLAQIHNIEDAKDQAKALDEALDRLAQRFADLNPQVIAAQTQNAILGEELADLKDKGDDLTAQERERITVIEATIKKGDEFIASQKANQDAVEAERRAVELLAGPEGYGLIQDALARSALALEEQTDVTGAVAQAYIDLQGPGGIGAALEGLDKLRLELDKQPEVWDAIAKALGPGFMDEIAAGVSNPDEIGRLVALMDSMGMKAGAGFAAGMRKSTLDVNAAVHQIVSAGIIDPFTGDLLMKSPSKVLEEMGRMAIAGLIIGLEEEAPRAEMIMRSLAQSLIEQTQALADRDAFGAQGAAFMSQLSEAIESGAPAAIDKVASAAIAIGDMLAKKLPERRADEITTRFMTAVKLAIEDGGDESRRALAVVMTEINEVLDDKLSLAEERVSAFREAWNAEAGRMAAENIYGRTGARLLDALREAIETESPKSITAVGALGASMIAELREKIPPEHAFAISDAFWKALRLAIEDGTPENIKAVETMMIGMVKAVEDAKPKIQTAGQAFAEALGAGLRKMADEDRFGKDGARLMEALRKAVEDGTPSSAAAAATAALGIMDALHDTLDPAEAEGYGASLMNAVQAVIAGGGAEALAALQDILDQIARLKASGTSGGGAAGGAAGGGAAGGATGATLRYVVGAPGRPGTWEAIDQSNAAAVADAKRRNFNTVAAAARRYYSILGEGVVKVSDTQKADWFAGPDDTWSLGPARDMTTVERQATRGLLSFLSTLPVPTAIGPAVSMATGSWRVPQTGPALIHAGEMVLPAGLAADLRSLLVGAPSQMDSVAMPARAPIGATGADRAITFDMRGAILTGSLDENERMLRAIVRDEIGAGVNRESFLYGRRGR